MPIDALLPAERYVPGHGRASDHAFFAAIKAQCPAHVSDANWRSTPPYLFGFDLYAAGYFWEAHEVWEPVWMACAPNSRERALTAGLIQLANGCLKLVMRRPKATMRLLGEASAQLRAAAWPAGRVMGLSPAALQQEIAAFEDAMRDAPFEDHEGLERLADRRPALNPTK